MRFSYSGGGFTILQTVVECVTGQNFAQVLRQLVFEPLGMTPSVYRRREQSGVIVHDGLDACHRSVPHVSGKSGCRVVDDAHRSTQARLSHSEVLGRRRLSTGRIWASETGIGTGDFDADR